MGSSFNEFCAAVLEDCVGEGVAISECLLRRESFDIRELAKHIQLRTNGTDSFVLNFDGTFNLLFHSQFILIAKMLYGDEAEIIIEELLKTGPQPLDELANRVCSRLDGSRASEIRKFCLRLCDDSFLRKDIPVDFSAVADALSSGGTKRRADGTTAGVDSSPIALNSERFLEYHRDKLIAEAAESSFGKMNTLIIRSMLNFVPMSSLKTTISTSLTLEQVHEAVQHLNSDAANSTPGRHVLLVQLNRLVATEESIVCRSGDSSSPLYSVDVRKAVELLAIGHCERIVLARFGNFAHRIFRLLLREGNLEQKQIEDMAMIAANDARKVLFNMVNEHFVQVIELSQSKDHQPGKSIYLFGVDRGQVVRLLLQRSYAASSKLILRRRDLLARNARLIQRSQHIENVLSQLQVAGTDASQIEEVEQLLTKAERESLQQVQSTVWQLECSELQIADTIFLFRLFLQLHPHL